MSTESSLREHLRAVLTWRKAHVSWREILTGVPFPVQGVRPPGAEHSPWEVLEHLRIAQWDILEFSRDPGHVSPDFPDGYWPAQAAPPDAASWDERLARFESDLQEMVDLVRDPNLSLTEPLAHGSGQTLLREALLLADHNAYHLGEMVLLRRQLGCWSGADPLDT